MHVAWIGLGAMGIPMVRNLAGKGYTVKAYNRTNRAVNIEPAQLVVSADEAIDGASVLFLMVSDGSAVRELLFGEGGIADKVSKDTLIVNMSTIGVEETKQMALEMANRGIEWMDAPVSGSVGPANSGNLVVLVGGSETGFRTIEPMLLTMGKVAYHLGPIGSGAAMKLLVNGFLAASMVTASECMAVAEKSGLGIGSFLQVLSSTGMWSSILEAKKPAWESGDYAPAFLLKHMTKDVNLLSSWVQQLSAGMPQMFSVQSSYLAAQANGWAEYDMSSVFEQVRKNVGSK